RARRVSLHGFDVVALGWMALGEVVSRNPVHLLGFADAVWCRARFRIIRARVARNSGSRSGFGARIAVVVRALAMARSTSRIAGLNSSVLDCELDRFFLEKHSAYCNGAGVWFGCASSAHRCIHLAWTDARYATEMGVSPAADCAVAVHDAYCGPFSVELSLAAIFSLSSCDLRGGSAANDAQASDRGYIAACHRPVNRCRHADFPDERFLFFSLDYDPHRARWSFVSFRISIPQFRDSVLGSGRDHVLRIACYVFLHSHKRRCAEIQFCSRAAQTCAARSTATLSQCLSLGGADILRLK